ncbi:hypothetical protein M7I_4986 [Glarea lozoyensis 74030]|uniref:Uncharacterized protein n=1 Tax=Glarea lozoyensis (strain ATCC 74030 / MF5533) TaxID=1104152 RepID=H0EQN2_GLAL7|nr:hypothetical protein M7I_4986 [Glarea lozoyensis 74030]
MSCYQPHYWQFYSCFGSKNVGSTENTEERQRCLSIGCKSLRTRNNDNLPLSTAFAGPARQSNTVRGYGKSPISLAVGKSMLKACQPKTSSWLQLFRASHQRCCARTEYFGRWVWVRSAS